MSKKKKMPPTPPAGRSPKGTGDDNASFANESAERREGQKPGPDPQENIEQNTTNQGYQQDR